MHYVLVRSNAIGMYVATHKNVQNMDGWFTLNLNEARRFSDINEILEFAADNPDAMSQYYLTVAKVETKEVVTLIEADSHLTN